MAIFEYIANDPSGNTVDGTFEAVDEKDARNILSQYNLTVQSLKEQGKATDVPKGKTDSSHSAKEKTNPKKKEKKKKKKGGLLDIEIGGGPTSEDISVFTRQMSTLIQAGLPLLRSLRL